MAQFFVTMPIEELESRIRSIIKSEVQKLNNAQSNPPDELMSIEEVQTFLHVSKVTIHKWKKRGRIKSYRIGRKIYFKKNEILNSMGSVNTKIRNL
jgi:excisionase family DNA binding protein